MKQKYAGALSNVAFNLNLRRYTEAARLLRDEGRRRWIASITPQDIVRAGAEFCRASVAELREEMSPAEDGRMVYRGKQDTPLLDLVGGVLRTSTRPTLDRRRESARMYEHSP